MTSILASLFWTTVYTCRGPIGPREVEVELFFDVNCSWQSVQIFTLSVWLKLGCTESITHSSTATTCSLTPNCGRQKVSDLFSLLIQQPLWQLQWWLTIKGEKMLAYRCSLGPVDNEAIAHECSETLGNCYVTAMVCDVRCTWANLLNVQKRCTTQLSST